MSFLKPDAAAPYRILVVGQFFFTGPGQDALGQQQSERAQVQKTSAHESGKWGRQQKEAEWIRNGDPQAHVAGYVSRQIEGWPVRVSKKLLDGNPEQTQRALDLLAEQLQFVKRVMPADAVAHLINVPIWFSPKYEGFRHSGEYHPGANWLRKQGRHPKLHRCVEFSNVPIFEKEIRRMPVLVIHELAHAYHDQVLGFDNAEVRACFEIAKNNGSYDNVLRGNGKREKAYAMSNEREYFAETSEAFFGSSDSLARWTFGECGSTESKSN